MLTGWELHEPTHEELKEMFSPQPMGAAGVNFAQGCPATYDTTSNHIFDSWTDADLFRAIDTPENGEPGEAHDREVAEYVEELKSRRVAREAQAAREDRLRSKYQI